MVIETQKPGPASLQNISCKNSKGSPYLHFTRYCGNFHKKNKNWKNLTEALKDAEAILSLDRLPLQKLGFSDIYCCIYPSTRQNIVISTIFPIFTSFFVVVSNFPHSKSWPDVKTGDLNRLISNLGGNWNLRGSWVGVKIRGGAWLEVY